MLSHFVDSILNLPPEVLSTWGYVIVFLISITESLPLIGFAIPGGVIVIAAGFFAKVGILDLTFTLILISIGAFIGDTVSFALGRRYGYTFLNRIGKYIFFKPVHFEKAKSVLQTHPRKALFGGRFHALTRCVVPFAAGTADVKTSLFLFYAAISCVVWTIINVMVGYVFGQGFQVASKYLGAVFFVALCLSVLVVYSYQFISRFTERNKQIIDRYQIYPLFINIISIYIVAKISESVLIGAKLHKVDGFVNHFFAMFRQPWLTQIFVGITLFATPTNLVILSTLLMVYFVLRHRWYFLILMPAALLSGVLSDSILKKMVHVARPLHPLVATTDFSFPSGHATVAVIFCGLLAYFFKDQVRGVIQKRAYVICCALAALVICVSRLYLNAHWLSDVLAGAALGTFWLTFYMVLFHFFTSLSPKKIEQEFIEEIK